jgi:hypothetical protein
MHSSRLRVLKRALLWEGIGILLATFALPALTLLVKDVLGHGLPSHLWMARFDDGVFWTFVSAILMAPLTFAAFCGWEYVTSRSHVLERTQVMRLFALLLLSGAIAILTGTINEWELIGQTSYWSESVETAGQVLPGVLVGVILPRWLVPSLRQGGDTSTAAA